MHSGEFFHISLQPKQKDETPTAPFPLWNRRLAPRFLGEKNSWHEALQRNSTFVPAENYSGLMLVLYGAGRSRFSSSLPSPELTKPLLSGSDVQGAGTGAGDAVLGWLQDQGCQLACAQSTETQETLQSPCQLHPGGSQTGTLKESGISLLRRLKGALNLTDQRHSRALVTPASLLGIPHKRLWAGGFAQVHFTVLTKKKSQ